VGKAARKASRNASKEARNLKNKSRLRKRSQNSALREQKNVRCVIEQIKVDLICASLDSLAQAVSRTPRVLGSGFRPPVPGGRKKPPLPGVSQGFLQFPGSPVSLRGLGRAGQRVGGQYDLADHKGEGASATVRPATRGTVGSEGGGFLCRGFLSRKGSQAGRVYYPSSYPS